MGSACSGKTTLIQQFLSTWSKYSLSTKTYRDVLKEKQLPTNKQGTEESQRIILDSLVQEIDDASVDKDSNIVFDRCVIDNVVYTLWLYQYGKVSQDFVIETKYKARNAVGKYDVLFYTPRSEHFKIEERENRETDLNYITEIDNIFSAVVASYENGKDSFFPLDDCPAVIRLNGPPDLRCDMIKMYLKSDGKPFQESDGSLLYV